MTAPVVIIDLFDEPREGGLGVAFQLDRRGSVIYVADPMMEWLRSSWDGLVASRGQDPIHDAYGD